MKYVLGIDSGGTKYLVRAAALDGTVLGEYRGASCSHYHLSAEAATQRISEYLGACLECFQGGREDCVAIVCGTTGYDSPEDAAIIAGIYAGVEGFHCPCCCMSDVDLAHYIATGGAGILVLAGTGSIAFGRNARGEERRIAGWPISIMGEEGSGRFIDAWALHHYSRYLDGFRPRTPIIDAIEQKTGLSTRKGLMNYTMAMHSEDFPAPNLGALVTKAAQEGDPYAQEILERAAEWSFRLVEELVQALDMERDGAFTVGIWGSVLMNAAPMSEAFRQLLNERYPQAVFSRPDRDAAQGAVEIALRWHRHGGDCMALLRSREA